MKPVNILSVFLPVLFLISNPSLSQGISGDYYYRLTNDYLKDGRSLDTYANTNKTIFMGTSGNYSGQKWIISPMGGNSYKITNKNFGAEVCLDTKQNSSAPFMGNWGNYNGQYWTITARGGGFYAITDAYGRALDTEGDGKNNPMLVAKGNYSGQYWKLTTLEKIQKLVSTNVSSWMSSIHDYVTIAQISIPGTHDSGADYGCPTFAFNSYALTQDLSIAKQLAKGIRFLDIRCRRNGKIFTIHHGACYQQKTFGNVLTDCNNFLKNNPTETILMNIQSEYNASDGSDSFADIFATYKTQYPIFYTSTDIPIMKDARGKIVIIDNAGLGMGISFSGPSVHKQNTYYLTETSSKWPLVEAELNLAKPSADLNLYLNFCTATGLSEDFGDLVTGFFGANATPKDFSKVVIPRLSKYLDANRTGRYGVLLMDFPTDDIIRKIIMSNSSDLVK